MTWQCMISSVDISYIAIMKKLHNKYYQALHHFYFLKTINVLQKLSYLYLSLHKNVFNLYATLSLITLILIYLTHPHDVTLLH